MVREEEERRSNGRRNRVGEGRGGGRGEIEAEGERKGGKERQKEKKVGRGGCKKSWVKSLVCVTGFIFCTAIFCTEFVFGLG